MALAHTRLHRRHEVLGAHRQLLVRGIVHIVGRLDRSNDAQLRGNGLHHGHRVVEIALQPPVRTVCSELARNLGRGL